MAQPNITNKQNDNTMTTQNSTELKAKVVMLGNTTTGKSSICVRFVKNEFDQYRQPTIGATFLTKAVSIVNFLVKFEIWDTAGQEKFRSLAPLYYRGASVALVIYDITNRETFESAKEWIKEVHSHEGKNIVIALAGNKVDLAHNRKVTEHEALEFAKKNKYIFFETSAKTNKNIKAIFKHIAMEIPNRQKSKKQNRKTILDEPETNDRDTKCNDCELL